MDDGTIKLPSLTRPQRLSRILAPGSVVFVGGSNISTSIDYARRNGFSGRIYIVNPWRDAIANIDCHASIADLPEIPDLAFIAVPKEAVVETVGALASFGVIGAVCNSAGFSEMREDGEKRQNALIAATGSMLLLGPNGPGFANFFDKSVFMQDHFGDHVGVQEGVAVISNGGAYLSDLGCARRSLPVGYLVGVGNQADLTIADLMDALLEDPRVKAINLYIESFRDVAGLSRAALKAIHQNVPVVVVKGGASSAGGRAAQTHTASLSGDATIASALFERFGFIEVTNQLEAIETLKMLVLSDRPTGIRTALATSSGSYAVLGGDAAEAAGLSLPPIDDDAADLMRPQLPHYVLPNNPLDISGGQFEAIDAVENTFRTFFASSVFDLAVLVMSFPPVGGWDPAGWYSCSIAFARAAKTCGLPCAFVNTMPEDLPVDARKLMIENGMVPLMGLDHGMRAIGAVASYAKKAARLRLPGAEYILLPELDHSREISAHARCFDEAQAKTILTAAGIVTPTGRVVGKHDLQNCAKLAFPLALKAVSTEIVHKTEYGAVTLGIANVDHLRQAIAAMEIKTKRTCPDVAIDSFLVEEMVIDGIGEIMVGIRNVPSIGLAMTMAIGGTAVELRQDAVTILLPSPRSAVAAALRSLKLFPLLDGWRGQPRADIDGALDAIEMLADFAVSRRDSLDVLEINPLILRPPGKGAVAADAVLRMACRQ
ncbi:MULTISPECIES: acetate--CoA ligase family protein [unclassified Mesorhizobium]|uniref:acetate--CoA ligase family protein n=1 Tax=unclassified Mesorhizobium TaxID=325217 RepID=UPI003336C43A